MSFFLLCGESHVQSSLLSEFAPLFLHVSTCLDSGRGVTTSSSSCRVLGGRHEACAVLYRLALRAALVHRRPGPCNARDALGSHGSRRELSRAHARHTGPLFCFSRFSPSRSVCHGPLRQQALFRTCLALFRDILLFFGGHFGSEVSCDSSVASASWASLLGGEPCSTLTHDTFTRFCLSLCCQIGPVFSTRILPATKHVVLAALRRGRFPQLQELHPDARERHSCPLRPRWHLRRLGHEQAWRRQSPAEWAARAVTYICDENKAWTTGWRPLRATAMPTSKKPSQRPWHSTPTMSSSPSTSSRSLLPKTPWPGPWRRRQTTRTTRPCQTRRLSRS